MAKILNVSSDVYWCSLAAFGALWRALVAVGGTLEAWITPLPLCRSSACRRNRLAILLRCCCIGTWGLGGR